jgi:hypothetical protein
MSDIEYSDIESNENEIQTFSYEDFDENAYGSDHTDYRYVYNKHYYEKIRSIVSDYYLSLGSRRELPTNYAKHLKKKQHNYLTEFESNYDDYRQQKHSKIGLSCHIHHPREGRVELYVENHLTGYFQIDKHNVMTIYVYRPYRGFHFAKWMIQELLSQFVQPMDDDLFYVETDMTDGFWDYLGCRQGKITFGELWKYVIS